MSDPGPLTRSKRGLAIEVAADLGDLLYDLTHDEKHRAKVGKLIKEARPDSPHAKAFKDVELEDRLSSFEQQQEQRELDTQRKAIVSRMEAQRQHLLDGDDEGRGRKYSEDDIKKIEELMQKKGLTDYEDGAALYSATMPQPGPLDDDPIRGSTWEFPEFAKFKDDPVKASKEVAYDVIREIQQKQRGRGR
jgi:hypothetical protein